MDNAVELSLELLDEAREHLITTIDLLKNIRGLVPNLAPQMDAYLISTLEQALSSDNEWLGGSNSCNLAALEAELVALPDEIE